MPQQYFNHFAGVNLVYPVDQREYYERFCQPGATEDRSPFPRMVDLWFVALTLAARAEIRPVDLSMRITSNFTSGAIFDRDSWRVQVVMLIAVAVAGDVSVVGNPNRMMAIGNGLAAAGVPRVVDMLEGGDLEPIWNLSEALYEILGEGSSDETTKPANSASKTAGPTPKTRDHRHER